MDKKRKMTSEMEVAPPHKLLALFTLRTLLALRKMLPPLTLLRLLSLSELTLVPPRTAFTA